jgi:hypothetical protein
VSHQVLEANGYVWDATVRTDYVNVPFSTHTFTSSTKLMSTKTITNSTSFNSFNTLATHHLSTSSPDGEELVMMVKRRQKVLSTIPPVLPLSGNSSVQSRVSVGRAREMYQEKPVRFPSDTQLLFTQ